MTRCLHSTPPDTFKVSVVVGLGQNPGMPDASTALSGWTSAVAWASSLVGGRRARLGAPECMCRDENRKDDMRKWRRVQCLGSGRPATEEMRELHRGPLPVAPCQLDHGSLEAIHGEPRLLRKSAPPGMAAAPPACCVEIHAARGRDMEQAGARGRRVVNPTARTDRVVGHVGRWLVAHWGGRWAIAAGCRTRLAPQHARMCRPKSAEAALGVALAGRLEYPPSWIA